MSDAQKAAERFTSIRYATNLTTDPRLSWNERRSIKWLLNRLADAETAKSRENPYTKAIAVLEAQSRTFEGSYG